MTSAFLPAEPAEHTDLPLSQLPWPRAGGGQRALPLTNTERRGSQEPASHPPPPSRFWDGAAPAGRGPAPHSPDPGLAGEAAVGGWDSSFKGTWVPWAVSRAGSPPPPSCRGCSLAQRRRVCFLSFGGLFGHLRGPWRGTEGALSADELPFSTQKRGLAGPDGAMKDREARKGPSPPNISTPADGGPVGGRRRTQGHLASPAATTHPGPARTKISLTRALSSDHLPAAGPRAAGSLPL